MLFDALMPRGYQQMGKYPYKEIFKQTSHLSAEKW